MKHALPSDDSSIKKFIFLIAHKRKMTLFLTSSFLFFHLSQAFLQFDPSLWSPQVALDIVNFVSNQSERDNLMLDRHYIGRWLFFFFKNDDKTFSVLLPT